MATSSNDQSINEAELEFRNKNSTLSASEGDCRKWKIHKKKLRLRKQTPYPCVMSRHGKLPASLQLSNSRRRLFQMDSHNIRGNEIDFDDFPHSTINFYRRIDFLHNVRKLKEQIFKSISEWSCGTLNYHEQNQVLTLHQFMESLVIDSLYENDWDTIDCSKFKYIDFSTKRLKMVGENDIVLDISASFDIIDENDLEDIDLRGSLAFDFSEFQCILYKYILPTSFNLIALLIEQNNCQVTPNQIFEKAVEANNFFFEYASSNVKYLRKEFENGYSNTTTIDMTVDREQLECVFSYALPLYTSIMTYIHKVIKILTPNINVLPFPDYICLRILFELTSNLYWFRMTSPKEMCGVGKLQEASVYIQKDICNLLYNEPRKLYFVQLREDHKALLLVHLVLVELRFSYTLNRS